MQMGHEDQFPRPRPDGRCRSGDATFAGIGGKEEDAPIVLKKPPNTQWRIDLSNIIVSSRLVAGVCLQWGHFIMNYYFISDPAVEFFNKIRRFQTFPPHPGTARLDP